MRFLFGFVISAVLASGTASADAPKTVASIKPVHSLVSAVMGDAGQPELIVEGAGSPHHYNLRPSQARKLQEADLVFWIGPELERFLAGPIESISTTARLIELIDSVSTLPYRDRDGEDDHGHEHDHAHDGRDTHIWLDPENAARMTRRIAEALTQADPENGGIYGANADRLAARIEALDTEIRALLAPVANRPFIAFHDAYQYFEKRYGLNMAGAITVNPEVAAGAERIRTLRARIKAAGVACVFSEPQFEPRLVSVVTEGLDVRTAVLDPLGAALPDGPELYFKLMRDMAATIRECLSD